MLERAVAAGVDFGVWTGVFVPSAAWALPNVVAGVGALLEAAL